MLTYCSGYRYEVFHRFIGTLYDTGFTGNVMFVSKMSDKENLDRLKAIYPNMSYVFDDSDYENHCQQKRFVLYRNLLAKTNLDTEYIFLCDSRDLFFQKNIETFPFPRDIDLFVFEEGLKIHQCSHNVKWLKELEDAYGEEILSKIQDKPISCSGTTFGKVEAIKIYIDRMCKAIQHEKLPIHYAYDQGHHNYLLYCDKLTDLSIRHYSNEDNFVNTLQYGFKWMNGLSQITNVKKEVSYVVHQWDRLPKYMTERLCAKYDFR